MMENAPKTTEKPGWNWPRFVSPPEASEPAKSPPAASVRDGRGLPVLMRCWALCWLILCNLLAAGCAWPEFGLPRGTHVRPMGAVLCSIIIAMLAAAWLPRWLREARQAWAGHRGWRVALSGVSVILCLLFLPLYLGVSAHAEQSRGLIVEK